MNIASYIDHTILKPATLRSDIEKLCSEALEYQFAAVCVPPNFVFLAKELTKDSDVKTATVIGFPFGYSTIQAKVEEVHQAIKDGADELDIVINISALFNDDFDYLSKEIIACLQPIRLNRRVVKVIIESGILSDDKIIACCDLYARHKVDFMKTSTGYAEKGASVEAVRLMRQNLPEDINIKASGGIRTFAFANELIAAGANRIGASASIAIVSQAT
ncbi:deoxyribose-phosphate aldolase [Taibaiella lutea]|uniref:Deoxyribose-phosphate aldolase n=1 Tax=Taibaiella lutea TaxID=2608001 RepID=A0A5M6CSV6_9BACT|nr:deoxyribose-phosphate aldolase [Taibaiella lutea]KAA5536125.1 deoxyribose-phosphate aldolase [Taibaiella lutea]